MWRVTASVFPVLIFLLPSGVPGRLSGIAQHFWGDAENRRQQVPPWGRQAVFQKAGDPALRLLTLRKGSNAKLLLESNILK